MARRGRGRPPHPDVLTPAEWSILDAWRHGMTRAVIAERRGVSVYAVRYHLRNVAGKLGVDRSSDLRQWPGFPVTSGRPRERNGHMNSTFPMGPLGQVSMLTRSAATSEAWFKEKLEIPHIFTFGDLVFFDCGGTRLFIREVPDAEWRPSSILYFLVPDIGEAHRGLTERGVKFQGAPHLIYKDDTTGVEDWMAFFDDPDGNMLAIMAHVAAEPGPAAAS